MTMPDPRFDTTQRDGVAGDVKQTAHSDALRWKQLYEAVLANTPDLGYVFDLNHRFIYANDALLAMWGKSWDEAIGKNCLELGYEPWHAAMHDREIEQVIATRKSVRGEVPFNGTSGRRIYDYIFFPVFASDGSVQAVGGSTRDISDMKAAQSALAESEKRFRALVAASSDVVYRMNADWTEMQQLQGRDFIADTESADRNWLGKYIHPEDQARVLESIHESVREKRPFELEHRVLRPDGTLGWTFSRAIPVLDDAGEIMEWFGAATDITARKQAEQALLRAEKLASLGRMAATISHEINNPLEAVTNLLFLARSTGDVPDVVRERLDTADAELNRIAHITRQSLGFYREANAPTVTSIPDLLNSCFDLLRGKIEAKRAEIRREWRADVKVIVVAGELRQVLSNLLANSLDAIDTRGKIRVRVSEQRGWKAPGQRSVRITMADNGSGIDPAAREHLFEPFFTTKGSVGTGLGLWVTKQIVDKHHGSIRVRSNLSGERRGTIFSIVLPADS
jgi:two-component system, chemotaxis family, sensor kinase Cph1